MQSKNLRATRRERVDTSPTHAPTLCPGGGRGAAISADTVTAAAYAGFLPAARNERRNEGRKEPTGTATASQETALHGISNQQQLQKVTNVSFTASLRNPP